MAPLSNICRRIFLNCVLQRKGRISCRLISTTEEKSKTSEACDPEQAVYRKIPDFSKPLKNTNWVSYGFNEEDKGEDRFKTHFMYFVLFSYICCGFSFIYAYAPDKKRDDWARREAFIRLHEREQLGLEIIDPNYIDASKIVLPPDEELSDEDIVI